MVLVQVENLVALQNGRNLREIGIAGSDAQDRAATILDVTAIAGDVVVRHVRAEQPVPEPGLVPRLRLTIQPCLPRRRQWAHGSLRVRNFRMIVNGPRLPRLDGRSGAARMLPPIKTDGLI